MKLLLIFGALSVATACSQSENLQEKAFRSYCKNYQFVLDDNRDDLQQLRREIALGNLDVERDLRIDFKSSRRKGSKVMPAGIFISFVKLEITTNSMKRVEIELPQTKISRKTLLSFSAPRSYVSDCFSISKTTIYDYIKGGVYE
jgi:hypothetical protein